MKNISIATRSLIRVARFTKTRIVLDFMLLITNSVILSVIQVGIRALVLDCMTLTISYLRILMSAISYQMYKLALLDLLIGIKTIPDSVC